MVLAEIIAKLRVSLAGNLDVMMVCDALERLMLEQYAAKKKFNRNEYQREYMRRYRARKRGALGGN